MRVLFTTWAWPTHYQPLVTLAWAFRAAGHEVCVASQPSLMPTVRASGLPGIALGGDRELTPVVDALLAVDPAVRGDGRTSRTVSGYAAIAGLMADPLREVMERWRPDLVVFEESTYAAPMVARLLGIPAVRHLWGVDILSYVRSFEPAALTPLAERLGLDALDTTGAATVDHCPPRLQVPGAFERLPMRYVPFNGSATLPAWTARAPRRPRICVTYGTTSSRLAHYAFVLDRIVAAVSDLPVEVVATVAGSDLHRLAGAGGNVRVVERMPLHALLPHCDLLVSQAGPSTALTAVSCGTPQLMIPQLPDQKLISSLVAGAGAGERLDLADATAETIRAAALRILSTPSHRASARALSEESRRLPGPAEVVRTLTRPGGPAAA
ncbi:glycosyltransferase [Streptomyces polychromogenes]|uniref:Glycosyltransferase n=1 Tax=Streptomyces polychromogenes TaxID=67342 RepID=A0ABN0VFT9_9ACTN